ncbi:hypothetical protein GCK72_004293 [Caenorhabditis remanei]|uniref:Uncharacterized protein n=1 Tax=Caenorhabditis remanei TaxID=31234 RepID=A0A6A5HBZ1_CAERE|nr:hypothetical protein GCK72_004293 [Caenorhabditis remanei]KAF1764346.1 hypothetical protein GCK72_004293 [Caenorhabditis remanei]
MTRMMTRRANKEIEEKNLGKNGKLWKVFTVNIIPELISEPCHDEDRDVAVCNPMDCIQSEDNLKVLMKECPTLGIEMAIEYLLESPLADAIQRGRKFVLKMELLKAEEEKHVGVPKVENIPPPPPQLEKKKEEPKKEQKKAEPTGRGKAQIKKIAAGVTKTGAEKKKVEPRKTQKKAPAHQKTQIKKVVIGVSKKEVGKKFGQNVRLGDLARELMASAAGWNRQRKVAFKCPKRFLQDENAPPTAEPMEY